MLVEYCGCGSTMLGRRSISLSLMPIQFMAVLCLITALGMKINAGKLME